MKKALLLSAGLLVGIGLLIYTFTLFPITQLTAMLISIPIPLLIAYFIISVLIIAALTLRWQIICTSYGIRARYHELFAYKLVGHAASFITPGPRVGGEAARAALLRRHGTPFSKGLSSVIADKTVEFSSFGVMFVLGLAIAFLTLDLGPWLRSMTALAGIILFVLITYGFHQMLRGHDPVMKLFTLLRLHNIPLLKKYQKELREFEHTTRSFYRERKRAFWASVSISAIAWSMGIIEYHIVLTMLGVNASFIEIFLVYSVVGVVYLIPVPMALGTFEAAQVSLFTALRLSTAAGAAVALITRTRDLIWTLIGFILLGYYGFDTLTRRK